MDSGLRILAEKIAKFRHLCKKFGWEGKKGEMEAVARGGRIVKSRRSFLLLGRLVGDETDLLRQLSLLVGRFG